MIKRPKNRELQYENKGLGPPGVIQKRLDLGCCPKCHTKISEQDKLETDGVYHCASCNLTFRV